MEPARRAAKKAADKRCAAGLRRSVRSLRAWPRLRVVGALVRRVLETVLEALLRDASSGNNGGGNDPICTGLGSLNSTTPIVTPVSSAQPLSEGGWPDLWK